MSTAVVNNTVPAATPLTHDQLVIYNTIEVSKKLGVPCDLKPTWEYYSKVDLKKQLTCPVFGLDYPSGFKSVLDDLKNNLKWNSDYGFTGIYNEKLFREIFNDPEHLKKLLTHGDVLVRYKDQIQWLFDNGYFPKDNESVKQIFDRSSCQ
jgi:hypothetical protein